MIGSGIFGTEVRVSYTICDAPSFIRWKKTHHKKRLREKFKKKYGPVLSTCKGNAYQVGSRMLVCPHVYEALRKEGL